MRQFTALRMDKELKRVGAVSSSKEDLESTQTSCGILLRTRSPRVFRACRGVCMGGKMKTGRSP